MEVLKNELRKVFTSKVLWGLAIFFICFNGFVIYEKSYITPEIKTLNKIIEKVGCDINPKMMLDLRNYYNEEFSKVQELIEDKTNVRYESLSEFKSDYTLVEYFTKDEIKFINDVIVIEGYYNLIPKMADEYNQIDIMELCEISIEKEGLTGKDAERTKVAYEEFNKQFLLLKENGEQEELFFKGLEMHSFLFKYVFGYVNIEIAIIVVLLTSFIVNYEFENKTQSIVYSTKKGRNLVREKIISSIIATVGFTAIILLSSLLIYFTIFDYSQIWGTSISSYFNWETGLPYICWFAISVGEYLILEIVLIFILQLIFSGITFILCKFVRNTYIVFTIFFIIYSLGTILPNLIGVNQDLLMISTFTPFTLAYNLSSRFMFNSAVIPMKWYELINLFMWSLYILSIGFVCIKRLMKENIV